ncbi:MAG: uracil-DNA glycosylase [Alphaproteobacteria bacterium]|nr:uracil-DNA glycosylase [Alphaproteobacteria bacterium]
MRPQAPAEPPKDCGLCPRLAAFRLENSAAEPDWFNGAVPSFGEEKARLAIVGLAPGLRGANRTGRPFTGDFAGQLLYATLLAYGFARGTYAERADDGLTLIDTLITNAVRCVPPQNKPERAEIATCRQFLAYRLAQLPRLRIVLALGRIAHESVCAVLGVKLKAAPFAHGAVHELAGGLLLIDSFHCSRYNTNTGRLTAKKFEDVFKDIRARLEASS